ncbi:MAG: FCD domain-containing protein [Lachnospiraceae bacterium]|nr:FCD domain-containing protein [Lachnospiraceae bacterium]
MNKNETITEQIMQYMKEQIINGVWAVGSKIPSENELCRDLGYSRTSIRSALQRYNVLGVLQSERGRGTFVRSDKIYLRGQPLSRLDANEDVMSKKHYLEWRQARNLIEPEIVYKIAKKADPELIEKLRRINQEQHEAIGDQCAYTQKDVEFHLALAEAYGNQIIENMMRELLSNQDMMIFGNEQFGFFGGIYYHVLIADAISRHDANRAKNLMYEHGLEAGEMRDLLKTT